MTVPKISIVTVNFNQALFIEQTIQSVLFQDYPNLEYIVIDGGSTDGSVDIIRKYESQLAYWVSEPDAGQYDAINKGFRHASGEVLGWINSDDFLLPNALKTVGSMFKHSDVSWLTSRTMMSCTEFGVMELCIDAGISRSAYHERLRPTKFIQQEQTFWTRRLFDKAVCSQIPATYSHAADMHLWCRFFEFADCHFVNIPLACFRVREGQASMHPQYVAQEIELCHEFKVKPNIGSVARMLVYKTGLTGVPVLRSIIRRSIGYQGVRLELQKHQESAGMPEWRSIACRFL